MAGETILIVEDNDVLRQGLEALLQAEGYLVLTAAQGFDALNQMQSVPPDLILSDISMPEMDGYTFFERVRARPDWVSIPFIFLTARRGREDIFAGKKLGAEDYLVKPVTRQELTTTIRSRLERSHQLLLAQLQQAYSSSLIMLANAIELRDQYTRGHVERVRDHAHVLATVMGLSPGQMEQIHYGSILHDIGKIHIPESVLKKPGPLTEAEWVEMRKHPLIGVDMVKDIPYLAPAIPVIRYHHERWDGQGYPDGVSGDAIPLVARIVTLADSLDAMSTTRPYQHGLSPDQAYEEILHGSGTMYDPQIVRAFQRGWAEIREHLH
jgi:putative two-component system response regulator